MAEYRSYDFLHSHSALEAELKFPKNLVLVDERYGDIFVEKTKFNHKGVTYYKVPILDFVYKNGTFKGLKR